MFMSKFKALVVLVFLSVGLPAIVQASEGGNTSGGGDTYTLNFIKTATQELFPWLSVHGAKLNPPVDASAFLLAINPEKIVSLDHVYESCDQSQSGREVDACYNAKTGRIFLSRTRYPLQQSSPEKLGLVAHEIFRKMGIEGNLYEVTRQMSIAAVPGSTSTPKRNLIRVDSSNLIDFAMSCPNGKQLGDYAVVTLTLKNGEVLKAYVTEPHKGYFDCAYIPNWNSYYNGILFDVLNGTVEARGLSCERKYGIYDRSAQVLNIRTEAAPCP